VLRVKQQTASRRIRPVERPASTEIRPRTGLHRETIRRALWSSTPPGYPRPSRAPAGGLNRPSPLRPRPTGSALATTGGLLVNPSQCQKGPTLDPAATGVQAPTGVDTTIAFSLEEALWIKRSQRVRSFGKRFAANVVSTSNSTADKRFWCARATFSARRSRSFARSTSAGTATGCSPDQVGATGLPCV
jgi:hypothetical protein